MAMLGLKEITDRYSDSMSNLQKEQVEKEIKGMEIEFVGYYMNIDSDSIIMGQLMEVREGYVGYLKLRVSVAVKYDQAKFGKILLSFPKEGVVRITGTIRHVTFERHRSHFILIDLISIADCKDEIREFKEMEEINRRNIENQNNQSSCFIATACYGDCDADEVLVFRRYRDERLMKTLLGRSFISFYYSVSPRLAGLIVKSNRLKSVVRKCLLQPLLKRIESTLK